MMKVDLKTIAHLTSKLPENPPIDNNDLLNPDYSSFYSDHAPSFVQKLFSGLITHNFSFNPKYFKKILDSVTEEREQAGYTENSILKINTAKKISFVMWGNVEGALHSLTRSLTELCKRSIINTELKILKEDFYFVFLGNVIGRSSYNIETLTLILQLMAVNGEKVIYLSGASEEKNLWEELNLGQELQSIARHLSSEKVPFSTAINRFFSTLPQALYLQAEKDGILEFIRLSHDRTVNENFDETLITNFLTTPSTGLTKENLTSLAIQQKSPKLLPLDAIVCSVNNSKFFHISDGLLTLPTEKGATVWSSFSSPTTVFQKIFGFFNDAFCILDGVGNVDQWTISLFSQDIRQLSGFKKKTYSFLIGSELLSDNQEASHSVMGNSFTGTIVVGCSLDLSKTSKIAGHRLKNGIELRINQENAGGGIAGNRLKVVFLDDGYTPTLALKNIQTFRDDYNTDIILSTLGSPTTEALLPLIKEGKINIYFPYTGLDALRDPSREGIVHYRAPYKYEVAALLDYAIDTLKLSRFALVIQEDAYGFGAMAGAKEAFASHGITEWLQTGYSRNTLNLDHAVAQVQEYSPQAIIFIATYAPAVTFVHKIGIPYLFNKQCLGVSFLTDKFRDFLKKNGLNFTITRVVPDFTGATPLPIVQEYLREQKKYSSQHKTSWDSLEGYINASIFIEALRQITPPFTKEKITAAIEGMRNKNLNGLALDFDPSIRGFNKGLIIDTGNELIPWTMQKAMQKKGFFAWLFGKK